ncbi:MAG: 3-hydroxyacyl-CoA dehydrogenase family protein [Peptococcaceae bacterium]|jgi:3-hydroxybutyryl-CoA dehydrogenase|nr:3-hydroxyacyl-CoA dehydrogenase family protein [Peptococcaceae bacterium]
MTIEKIGVLGSGAMGSGIAQVAAAAGIQVVLKDVDLSVVEKARGRIGAFLQKSEEKGRLAAGERDRILARIQPTDRLEDMAGVDMVIEAIIEDLAEKQKAFAALSRLTRPDVILASNTSSMSITLLARATDRPELVAGMHFFNPPPLMRLVEVIRGFYTSDACVARIKEVAQAMGKSCVEVKKDSPGFVVNRILLAQFAEAIRLVEEGVATPEDIDQAVRLGLNYPMGPFELQDFTGVDICYYVMEYFLREFQETRWNPPQSLKALIRAGRLGRKTGAGWYDHQK